MKTTFLCAVAALAAVLLVSATVWEGVTDVAFARDLPRAYSIATNSFPRNTVVDITNLENGKLVRVIVISGLETTGLLATLSKNAADAIDLRHDSTCRIRMTQASVNASQYARAGDPPPVLPLGPIDSSGALASAAESETPASRPAIVESAPAANRTTVTENAAVASKPPVTENAPPANRTTTTENVTVATRTPTTESVPSVNEAPATEDVTAANNPPVTEDATPANRTVTTENVTTAESVTPANRPAAAESAPVASRTPVTESAAPASRPAAVSIIAAESAATEDDVITADEPAVTDNVIAVSESIMTDNAIAADEPAVTDNAIVVNESIVTDNVVAAAPAEAVTKNQPEPRMASGTLTLIPAEERPPSEQHPAVSRAAVPKAAAPRDVASREVAPNDAAPRNTASRDVASRDAPPPVNQTTETPAAYAPPAEFSPFQAPLINKLEQGKWYVQIGVYSRPDNVEEEISRIGSAYPVAIQNIGSDSSPMFRVLLGPLNQGESGAMLQRFKSIGYPDAFVRHN